MPRRLQIDGVPWRVRALTDEAFREEPDPWHLVRVRFDPPSASRSLLPRETWLRLEEDVPARDVLDQYRDEELVEAFLAAEEVAPDA